MLYVTSVQRLLEMPRARDTASECTRFCRWARKRVSFAQVMRLHSGKRHKNNAMVFSICDSVTDHYYELMLLVVFISALPSGHLWNIYLFIYF